MKRLLLLLLIALLSLRVVGQVKPRRAFIPVDVEKEQVRVVCEGRFAYVVKSSRQTTELSLIGFDTLLNELWAVGLQRSLPSLSLVKAIDLRLFLLMTDPSGKELDVLELDGETGHYTLFSYTFSRPFQVRDFEAWKEHMWCSGFINGEGIAFNLDPGGGVKTLPVGFQNPIDAITSLQFNERARELGFLLRTSVGKRSVFVTRSVDLEGKVRRNELFESPGGYNLKDFKARDEIAVGSIFKGNSDQLRGLTVWVKNDQGDWSATDHLWQTVQGMQGQLQIDNKDRTLQSKKGKWDNGPSRMENLRQTPSGVFFGIDVFARQYTARSAMQREQDKEILVNQLDQNQFGRQGFDSNESTLDERIDRFSNTDFTAYRFRDVLVGPLDDAGVEYAGTLAFHIGRDGELRGKAIKVHPRYHKGTADRQAPLTSLDDQSVYLAAAGDRLDLIYFDRPEPAMRIVGVPMGPWSLSWLSESLLNFGFVSQEETAYLFLQRYDFGAWAPDSPQQ